MVRNTIFYLLFDYSYSKTRINDSSKLEIVDSNEVQRILKEINSGETIELDEIVDPSAFWSAVVYAFQEFPIIQASDNSIDDAIKRVSDGYRRACGPLLSTAEFLVETYPNNCKTIISSLHMAFVEPNAMDSAPSLILALLQDYKSYFPYTYTFCRRLGRSPTLTMDQWTKYLFQSDDTNNSSITNSKGKNATTPWDIRQSEEEDEHSSDDDRADYKPTPLVVKASPRKKRVTRMSSSSRKLDSSNSMYSGAIPSSGSLSKKTTAVLVQDFEDVDSSMEILDISANNFDDLVSDKVSSNNKYGDKAGTGKNVTVNSNGGKFVGMTGRSSVSDDGLLQKTELRRVFKSTLMRPNDLFANTE